MVVGICTCTIYSLIFAKQKRNLEDRRRSLHMSSSAEKPVKLKSMSCRFSFLHTLSFAAFVGVFTTSDTPLVSFPLIAVVHSSMELYIGEEYCALSNESLLNFNWSLRGERTLHTVSFAYTTWNWRVVSSLLAFIANARATAKTHKVPKISSKYAMRSALAGPTNFAGGGF